ITRHSFERPVARVARSTEHLQCVVGSLDCHLRGEDLRLRRLGHLRKATLLTVRCPMDQQAGCGYLCCHVGEHPLYTLELTDWPAKLGSFAARPQNPFVSPRQPPQPHLPPPPPGGCYGL